LPVVVTAPAITVAPRTTIAPVATILARRPVATLRTALGTCLPLALIRPLLRTGFAFVRLAFAGFGFDGLSLAHLAVGILARAAIAAAVTRAAVTFLALAIGWRRGVCGDGLAIRRGSRCFACGLTFGGRCRALMMTAAATAPFRVAGATFALGTTGTPDLDHLRLGGRCGDSFSRCGRGFSADKFNAR
jgi:hypothetical protein